MSGRFRLAYSITPFPAILRICYLLPAALDHHPPPRFITRNPIITALTVRCIPDITAPWRQFPFDCSDHRTSCSSRHFHDLSRCHSFRSHLLDLQDFFFTQLICFSFWHLFLLSQKAFCYQCTKFFPRVGFLIFFLAYSH